MYFGVTLDILLFMCVPSQVPVTYCIEFTMLLVLVCIKHVFTFSLQRELMHTRYKTAILYQFYEHKRGTFCLVVRGKGAMLRTE
jgi:hypothetical protein